MQNLILKLKNKIRKEDVKWKNQKFILQVKYHQKAW